MKRLSIAKLFVPAIPILLTGCMSLGPDYKAPEWEGPQSWSTEVSATSPLPDGVSWWTVFNDPVLNELEAALLEQNLSLAATVARLDASAAQLGIARSAYAPYVNATGSVAYDRASNEAHSSSKLPDNPDWLYTPGIGFQWELDFWGRVRRNVEATSAEFSVAVQDVRSARLLLASNLADSYILLRTLQTRLDYARKNVALQSSTLELVRTRVASELCGELDLRQAEMLLATTRASIPPIETYIDAAINSIATLVGAFPGTQNALRTPAPIPVPAEASLPASLPAELLRNRPDVIAAAERFHAAVARIGAAKAEFFPKISFNGSFEFAATGTGNLFTKDASRYSIGPAIEWPIFTAGRLRNQVLAYEASARAEEAEFRQTVLNATAECENALSSRRAANAALEDLRAAVVAAEKAVELADSLYRAGLTDFQNVLDMQRQLSSNQDALAQGLGKSATALVDVWQAFATPYEPPRKSSPESAE